MPEQRVAGGADATRGPCASHAAARSAASVVDELRLPQRTGDVWRPGGDDVVLVLLLDVAVAVRAADSDVAVDAELSLTAWSIEHMRGSASIAIRFGCPSAWRRITVRAPAWCQCALVCSRALSDPPRRPFVKSAFR